MSKSYLVAGLGFGDEGKGSIVDFISKKTGLDVVRYNGGPQAGHHVVKNGIVHRFSQFGSGSFNGSKTFHLKSVLVDPLSIEGEAEVLMGQGIDNVWDLLNVHEDCVIITPFSKIVGRMREIGRRYGSCGEGVGEAVRDSRVWDNSIRMKDFKNWLLLKDKLEFFWRVKLDQAEQLAETYKDDSQIQKLVKEISKRDLVDVVFDAYSLLAGKINVVKSVSGGIYEGAQGVLLDEKYGFWPHVTKTDITFNNALENAVDLDAVKIGVLRSYFTRHGNGPFVSEEEGLSDVLKEEHNSCNLWQGEFRAGWMDVVAARYSVEVLGGIDYLALTNFDKTRKLKDINVCVAYEYHGKEDVDDLFDFENGKMKIVTGIKVNGETDKERQYSVTRALLECSPVYECFNSRDYLRFLESERGLNVPIGILSEGTGDSDKRLLALKF